MYINIFQHYKNYIVIFTIIFSLYRHDKSNMYFFIYILQYI